MRGAELTLLHTNDMHGRRTVFPYLERHPKPADALLVDAGDAIRGSNTMFHLCEPVLDRMNQAGYDAMAIGNREFHYLRRVLGWRARQLDFPLVCANVFDLRHRVNHLWRRSVLLEVNGLRVGLTGLTPVQYPDDSLWKPVMGFRFSPWCEVLGPVIRDLVARVDLVVLLSHQGFETDCQIAASVPGIHVIVGGHSHHRITEPRVVEGTAVVQAGSHGRNLGRMRLRVGPDGSVEILDYVLVSVEASDSTWPSPSGGAARSEEPDDRIA